MISNVTTWLPTAAMAAAETTFALTMFLPAYGVAAAIMAARRRQLERDDSAQGPESRSLDM